MAALKNAKEGRALYTFRIQCHRMHVTQGARGRLGQDHMHHHFCNVMQCGYAAFLRGRRLCTMNAS